MSRNKKPKPTNSAPITDGMRNPKIKETGSEKPLISLEKVMDCNVYGLCLKEHSLFNQYSNKCNTALIKLFHIISQKSWKDILQIKRQSANYGYECISIGDITAQSVKSHFLAKCGKTKNEKMDVFRFGGNDFRACGFKEKGIFYLVCIEYDRKKNPIYNHGS